MFHVRSSVGSHPGIRHGRLRFIAALVVSAGALVVPVLQAGANSPPVINSLTASTAVVAPEGGSVKLTAVVSGGGTCTVSVTPAVSGFPLTEDCIPLPGKPKKTVLFPASLSANASNTPIKYKWTLSVRTLGSTKVETKVVTITEWAYHVTATNFSDSAPAATGLTDISCVGSNFCMVVGAGGTSGSVAVQSKSIPFRKIEFTYKPLEGVSCASSTMCVMIDNAGDYYIYNGTSVSPPYPVYKPGTTALTTLTSVSCASTLFCMVTDAFGNAFGGTPTKLRESPTLISNTKTAVKFNVSCALATFCAAADLDGDAFFFDGHSWSTAVPVSTKADGIIALSCSSMSGRLHRPPVCYAGTDKGHLWTISPPTGSTGTYRVRESPTQPHRVDSISCSSTTYCMAGDGLGGLYPVVNGLVGGKVLIFGGLANVGASCSSGGNPVATTCIAKSKEGKKEYVGHVTLMK